MDQSAIRDVLHRIATRPDFRRQFEADPVGTLASEGITIDTKLVPTGSITLPSNEDILKYLDEWSTRIWNLDQQGGHMPLIWLGLS